MTNSLTRRGFLGWLGTAAAAPPPSRPQAPAEAWIILEQNWQYNDEVSYPEGQLPREPIYYDPAQAEAECQRLCQHFYAQQTPEEFEVDWQDYFDVDAEFDGAAVTWEALLAAGCPPPFQVQRLTAAGEGPA